MRMAQQNPSQIAVPMPIRTPRLLIRPRQTGDHVFALEAIRETWDELHKWMVWAEDPSQFTLESLEKRNRHAMANFLQRDVLELIGFDVATGQAVIWCGLHDIDWQARECDTGYWVRQPAQRQGFATESTNALVRYAFGALGMTQVRLTHSEGNEASRRIAGKLGFQLEGVEESANPLSGGRMADRIRYICHDPQALPPLEVSWGKE